MKKVRCDLSCGFGAALVVGTCLISGRAFAQDTMVLSETPAYLWYHGCSPTSGMMAFGYWDGYGFSNLIPGSNDWSGNLTGIKNAIASSGHIQDYALYGLDPAIIPDLNGRVLDASGEKGLVPAEDYFAKEPFPDMSTVDPSHAHADDSLADFMGTSRSAEGLNHGFTHGQLPGHRDIPSGLEGYASYKGYAFAATNESLDWGNFVHEIQMGRPVLLNVDAPGGTLGQVNHTVAAMGYRATNGYREYGCYDTVKQTIHWEQFRSVSTEYEWGIGSMIALNPANTWDAQWKISDGDWNSTWSWSNDLSHLLSVPDAATFTYIPTGDASHVSSEAHVMMVNVAGTLDIQHAGLTTQAMRLCPNGVILLDDSDSALDVSSMIFSDQGIISGQGRVNASVTNNGFIHADNGYLEITGRVNGTGNIAVNKGAALGLSGGGLITGNLQNDGDFFVNGSLELNGAVQGSGNTHLDSGAALSTNNSSGDFHTGYIYLESAKITIQNPLGKFSAQNVYANNGSRLSASAQSFTVANVYLDQSQIAVSGCTLACTGGGSLWLSHAAWLNVTGGGVNANQAFLSNNSHLNVSGDTTFSQNIYLDSGSQFSEQQAGSQFAAEDVYASGNAIIQIAGQSFSGRDLYLGDFTGGGELDFNGQNFSVRNVYLTRSRLSVGGSNVFVKIGSIHEDVNSQVSISAELTMLDAAYTNAGILTVTAGSLAFNGGFTQTQGELSLADGAVSSPTPFNIEGGVLDGNGTVNGDVENNGVVSPGHSPGSIVITGQYSQSSDGVIAIELAGGGAGEFDVLEIGGTADLAGTLQISLLDGFIPAVGDQFDILNYADHVGTFDSILMLDESGVVFQTEYNANELILVITAIPEPQSVSVLILGSFLLRRRRRKPS